MDANTNRRLPMPIPEFQTFMLPLLRVAGDGSDHTLAAARDVLATEFGLTEDERAEVLPSGQQRRFDNRVAWAKAYLTYAGLLSSAKRAHFQITQRGKDVLVNRPERIDTAYLRRFPEFLAFQAKTSSDSEGQAIEAPRTTASSQAQTPEEQLDQAFTQIRTELAGELLGKVKAGSAKFFEDLVVDLLLRMGYGGNRAEAGRAIGRSGDEGIDGIISEDRLGLDNIYIQAKKWDGTVGRPDIQKFVGALHGKRAKKGVFITTGGFSAEARDYVATIDPRVVLIDGTQLADYMIDCNLGVAPKQVYEMKRLDSDFFDDDAAGAI